MKEILHIDTSTESSVKNSFNKIAERLFYNTCLVVNENSYQLVDFEFYFSCESHSDGYTLPHTAEIGILRPHKYGMDISLGGELHRYGGILIRGMIKNQKEIILKPNILREIISSLKMGQNHFNFQKDQNFEKYNFIATSRVGLGDKERKENSQYFDEKYRYILCRKEYIAKLGRKSIILNKSELPDDEVNFLIGYKLRK